MPGPVRLVSRARRDGLAARAGAAHTAAPEQGPARAPEVSANGRARESTRRSTVLYTLVSVALLLGAWQVASEVAGPDVLPGPWVSVSAIQYSYQDGYLFSDIGITALRVLAAFGFSLLLSLIGGVLLGRVSIVARIFGPWVVIGASIPALVYVVVAYLVAGLNDAAAVAATVLVVAPPMTFNIWDGVKALNPEFAEMARAFQVPRATILRRVLIPQTFPFVFTAARAGLSLTWRIMIFVELVGRSSGVGYRIQFWYNLFNMRRVLAAAIPFVTLMLLVEFGVLRPLERHVFRWQRQELR